MPNKIRVAIIGLDTSHAVEFARSMNDPMCPEERRITGMTAVSCLRFSTPFQSEEGLDQRQRQLESWGVRVTQDFAEAVTGCDAIMLEINDPAYHLEYFVRCSELVKPMYIDKPLADTVENGRKIYDLAKSNALRVFSASSLRFVSELRDASAAIPQPMYVWTYGPLGKAPAGSSIIWYGVHSFEMLQRAMGPAGRSVSTTSTSSGVVCVVDYQDGRRGVVELTDGSYLYGGCLRGKDNVVPYNVNMTHAYTAELKEIEAFFAGGKPPCSMEDALEVMAMLDAAEKSLHTKKPEPVAVLPA